MKSIAKILAFYFLVGSIFPNTDFSQMTKFFNLYQHFQLHKAQKEADGEAFSMMEFLTLHYTQNGEHKHSNNNTHQQLPLHHFGHSADFVAQNIPLISIPEFNTESTLQAGFPQWISSEFTKSVFQPPVAA